MLLLLLLVMVLPNDVVEGVLDAPHVVQSPVVVARSRGPSTTTVLLLGEEGDYC